MAAKQRRVVTAAADQLLMERFRVLERIGSGGMGTVYRAYDERLQRQVAIKEVVTGEPARVLREAQAAARLNHPGIATVYELGEREGRPLLVSELVPGPTLAQLRRDGGLSDRELGELGVDLCEALSHAHAHGVVHRDIKPDNVIVRGDADVGRRAKLMDFGIARIEGAETLTATGEVVGTLAYMSPEQAEGLIAGPASDVYSLGLVLYEAWAGANPVAAPTPAETARRIGVPVPALAGPRPDLPAALAETIDACLDPDPSLRPEPRELRDRLIASLDRLDPEGCIPAASDQPPGFPATPSRLGVTLATACVALVLPALGLAAAMPALAGLAPRPIIRGVLGLLCWAWAIAVTDTAITTEAVGAGAVFAAAALAIGPVLAARHAPLALVGALVWAAAYDAALRLIGDAGFGEAPLVLGAAAAAVVAAEFGLLRADAPGYPAPAVRDEERALRGRLA